MSDQSHRKRLRKTESSTMSSNDSRMLGPWMDRPEIQKSLFSKHPLTTGLCTYPLFTCNPSGNVELPTRMARCEMTFLIIFMKAYKNKKRSEADVKLGFIMELMARHLPSDLIHKQNEAINILIDTTKELLTNNIGIYAQDSQIVIGDVTYTLPLSAEAPLLPTITTLDSCFAILSLLRQLVKATYRSYLKDTVIEFYCSIVNRGNMTDNKIERLTTNLEAQTGRVIALDTGRVRLYYTHTWKHLNPNNVKTILREWKANISDEAVCKLISQQAGFVGMTPLITVGRAILNFPDFRWDDLEKVFPGEQAAWKAAMDVVKGNACYRFLMNMGIASSRHYNNLAYVAKELLIRSGGNDSLKSYIGWFRTCKAHKSVIALIEGYIAGRSEFEDRVAVSTDARSFLTATCNKYRKLLLGAPEDLLTQAGTSQGSSALHGRDETDDDDGSTGISSAARDAMEAGQA